MLSVTFIVCVFTKRVIAWALELVLWREHLIGSAAIVAKSKYNGQKSVGDGCKQVIALWKISSVTRGANLHLTCSKLSIDKCRNWPTINTGWFWGSVCVSVLLNENTVLVMLKIEGRELLYSKIFHTLNGNLKNRKLYNSLWNPSSKCRNGRYNSGTSP